MSTEALATALTVESSKMGCVDTVADPLVFRNYNPSMDHSDLMVS